LYFQNRQPFVGFPLRTTLPTIDGLPSIFVYRHFFGISKIIYAISR
jgi:hypothetical protein